MGEVVSFKAVKKRKKKASKDDPKPTKDSKVIVMQKRKA